MSNPLLDPHQRMRSVGGLSNDRFGERWKVIGDLAGMAEEGRKTEGGVIIKKEHDGYSFLKARMSSTSPLTLLEDDCWQENRR